MDGFLIFFFIAIGVVIGVMLFVTLEIFCECNKKHKIK